MVTKQLSGINVRKPTPNVIGSRCVKNTKIDQSLKNSDCKSVKQLHTKTTTNNDQDWDEMMEFFKANPSALMNALPTPPGSN